MCEVLKTLFLITCRGTNWIRCSIAGKDGTLSGRFRRLVPICLRALL